jgi:hypothetical protein
MLRQAAHFDTRRWAWVWFVPDHPSPRLNPR